MILVKLGNRVGAATCRTGALREQHVWNFSVLPNELIDRVRPLLDQLFVRAGRSKLCNVYPMVFAGMPVRNVQLMAHQPLRFPEVFRSIDV
jgi:hypothetical protein